MKNINKSFKIANDVVISEVDDESILLDLNTGKYFKVNELGSFIINHISEFTSLEILENQIVESFDVTLEKCQDDLLKFIEELQKKNLLHFK
tara:strand:- start:3408 stop:3683 length:276 start_codon:yes stop_codon:yes gene_type:complete